MVGIMAAGAAALIGSSIVDSAPDHQSRDMDIFGHAPVASNDVVRKSGLETVYLAKKTFTAIEMAAETAISVTTSLPPAVTFATTTAIASAIHSAGQRVSDGSLFDDERFAAYGTLFAPVHSKTNTTAADEWMASTLAGLRLKMMLSILNNKNMTIRHDAVPQRSANYPHGHFLRRVGLWARRQADDRAQLTGNRVVKREVPPVTDIEEPKKVEPVRGSIHGHPRSYKGENDPLDRYSMDGREVYLDENDKITKVEKLPQPGVHVPVKGKSETITVQPRLTPVSKTPVKRLMPVEEAYVEWMLGLNAKMAHQPQQPSPSPTPILRHGEGVPEGLVPPASRPTLSEVEMAEAVKGLGPAIVDDGGADQRSTELNKEGVERGVAHEEVQRSGSASSPVVVPNKRLSEKE